MFYSNVVEVRLIISICMSCFGKRKIPICFDQAISKALNSTL